MAPRRFAHDATWARLNDAQRGAWLGLLRVHRDVVRRLDAALSREHGLTLAEWDALVHVAGRRVRMGELAQHVLLSASGMTRMMERLESRGLVERHRGEADARESWATITRAGLDLLARAAPTHNEELEAHFLHALTPQETETLAALMQKVVTTPSACARHEDE